MLVRLREEVAKSQGAANGEDNGMNGMAYALDTRSPLWQMRSLVATLPHHCPLPSGWGRA